ncbi:hypothetical protein TWF106_000154 [Orbilia oligospora]|uniref:Uncharacterized protein n=2 Tax=Orbilia oligospora TaxID=2813651 RepID=A0A6G1MN11_ORBOL|nr:hypothetical protein TWF106_000154 [Orbilia oligospora]KAF3230068.1 hypothetical protein TWF191_000308 [Orbilia oligospora]KAF3262457.1 hypothetical protein TWF192_007132 [Orbilia oligospora]
MALANARLREEFDPRIPLHNGILGFDWYYQAKLNTGFSQLSEKLYRELALDYIRIGHNGRRPYILRARQSARRISEIVPARRCAKEEGLHIVPRVPVTLYTNRERYCCLSSGNFGSEFLFFRTWFGDDDHSSEDSDKLYEQFISGWKNAWTDEEFIIDQRYCFTDSSYSDVPTACMRSEAHTSEEWLLTRLPDELGGMDIDDDQYTEADLYEEESICFVIADREAIINGWLLISAINHKGCVIGRWRLPAGDFAASLISRRFAIPESMSESIYYRGFGDVTEPDIHSSGGVMFDVSDPPGLWWDALDRRGFTRKRPSEKVPLGFLRK